MAAIRQRPEEIGIQKRSQCGKTYQNVLHFLRHVLSITNNQLDFFISVGKGQADSSEIELLDWLLPKKSCGKKNDAFKVGNRNVKFFDFKRGIKKFESPDSSTFYLESPEFAGIQLETTRNDRNLHQQNAN